MYSLRLLRLMKPQQTVKTVGCFTRNISSYEHDIDVVALQSALSRSGSNQNAKNNLSKQNRRMPYTSIGYEHDICPRILYGEFSSPFNSNSMPINAPDSISNPVPMDQRRYISVQTGSQSTDSRRGISTSSVISYEHDFDPVTLQSTPRPSSPSDPKKVSRKQKRGISSYEHELMAHIEVPEPECVITATSRWYQKRYQILNSGRTIQDNNSVASASRWYKERYLRSKII